MIFTIITKGALALLSDQGYHLIGHWSTPYHPINLTRKKVVAAKHMWKRSKFSKEYTIIRAPETSFKERRTAPHFVHHHYSLGVQKSALQGHRETKRASWSMWWCPSPSQAAAAWSTSKTIFWWYHGARSPEGSPCGTCTLDGTPRRPGERCLCCFWRQEAELGSCKMWLGLLSQIASL